MKKAGLDTLAAIAAPYKGDKPYIFISYAHKDKGRILPILNAMLADGYRVWFDEGIDPGTEWDQNIAEHIEKSDYVIAFLSGGYMSSENCKDELNYARDLNKKRVLVYLEPVQLPAGMAMRLNRLQSIYYQAYETQALFLQKLYAADGISLFCDKAVPLFENAEQSGIPKAAIEVCKGFSEGLPEDRFVFVCGWDYRNKKALLSAIKGRLTERKTDFIAVQMEQFTDELIRAIVQGETQKMRKKYAEIPVLVLDGLEAIAGKESTQEEVYRSIRNRFYEDKPTLILAPQTIMEEPGFDKRLIELISGWVTVSA